MELIVTVGLVIIVVTFIVLLLSSKNKPEKKLKLYQQYSLEGQEENEGVNWANSLIYLAGFEWDPAQKIYITRRNAMQRIGGYTSLYDDLSTLLNMVIDIEPIRFSYAGVNYMIELWKGQYYAATGCEIGIYTELKGRPGVYKCATNDQMLHMSYTLLHIDASRQVQQVFSRSGVHWWLTGFKPGFFSSPTQLYMDNIKIIFPSTSMADTFYHALLAHFHVRRTDRTYSVSGTTVSFSWHKPTFLQPNIHLRSVFLKYNQLLTEGSNNIMNNNYAPSAINDKIVEIQSFLEQGDNFFSFIDYLMSGNPSILVAVTQWDIVHGNDDMANIFSFLAQTKRHMPKIHTGLINFICFFDRSVTCSVWRKLKHSHV